MEGVGVYGEKDFRKRYVLSFEWKRVEVMAVDIGDDGSDKFRWFGWEEKSEKKNDQDEVDGMRQEYTNSGIYKPRPEKKEQQYFT